jgi:hypothetical protein
MSLMKLMISELKDRSRYTSREAAYIIRELIDNYGWSQIETEYLHFSPGSLESLLLGKFGQLPKVVLFWEGYYLLKKRRREIEALDCDKYILCDDLHDGAEETIKDKLQSFSMFHAILSTYGYVFYEYYSELAATHKVFWVPHSASPDFLITYNEHPENAVFLSGAVNHYYPLRLRVKALADSRVFPIVLHQHPGYRCDFDYDASTSVGREYARKINNYRAAFTDSSKYKYSVAKYFEIPATGALLLADRSISEPLRSVGFVEGVNYIGVTDHDLEEKIAYVLDESNHDEVDKIRRNGQDLVWQTHKTSDRARLIDEICSYDKDASSLTL